MEAKKIMCKSDCSFMIQSNDEKELIGMARVHGMDKHNTEASDELLQSMLEKV